MIASGAIFASWAPLIGTGTKARGSLDRHAASFGGWSDAALAHAADDAHDEIACKNPFLAFV